MTMEASINTLIDSCKLLLGAVSERDHSRLNEVLALQREQVSALVAHLDQNAQDELLASIQQAHLLATLQRAHVLESVKNCQHQLAILQTYQQNLPAESSAGSRG